MNGWGKAIWGCEKSCRFMVVRWRDRMKVVLKWIVASIITCVVIYFCRDLILRFGNWFFENPEGARNVIYFFAALFGGYLLYQRTKAAKEDVETAKKVLTAERLTRAIEQLASDKPSVRLGGIRSLEQIADAHEEEHMRIMQILVARIREFVKLRKEGCRIIENADIQVAFEALANIVKPLGKQKRKFFELSNADFSKLSVAQIDLSYFPMQMMVLSQVYFLEVDFTGTNLNMSTIDKATFDNCKGLTKEQVMSALWGEGGRPCGLPKEWNLPIVNLHPQQEN